MAKTLRKLSEKEWLLIQKIRGQEKTGYSLHTTKNGEYYFWPMGLQPANPVIGATPKIAAKNFLKVFHRRGPKDDPVFHTPKKRKTTKPSPRVVPAE